MRLIIESPAYVLSIDEVPLKNVHVKDVQVKTIGLNTVELAVSPDFGLALIEVTLRPCFTVELFDFR